jgi:hypothetical protein
MVGLKPRRVADDDIKNPRRVADDDTKIPVGLPVLKNHNYEIPTFILCPYDPNF